jgi:hypothetical protein
MPPKEAHKIVLRLRIASRCFAQDDGVLGWLGVEPTVGGPANAVCYQKVLFRKAFPSHWFPDRPYRRPVCDNL